MTNVTLLGGLSAHAFLARYWQRRFRFIRNAVPDFPGLIDWPALAALAARDDVQSRLVIRSPQRGKPDWHVEHGPFRARDLRGLPATHWTMLVQGLNHVLPAADRLLARFRFVPYARTDDVMVSYARPGGGVGPHLDSYDVFLLQGPGRRRWRISTAISGGAPPRFIPNVGLKILASFRPTHEYVLDAGDMLYLPPEVAHDGVALDTCTTYSIGFRTPSDAELAEEFLAWLGERLRFDGRYRDRDASPARHAAEIPRSMIAHAERVLARVDWARAEVATFLGCYLSTPKAHACPPPPARPITRATFRARLARRGVRLDPRSILLTRGRTFYMNGAPARISALDYPHARRLADERVLDATSALSSALLVVLYDWYLAGGLHPGAS